MYQTRPFQKLKLKPEYINNWPRGNSLHQFYSLLMRIYEHSTNCYFRSHKSKRKKWINLYVVFRIKGLLVQIVPSIQPSLYAMRLKKQKIESLIEREKLFPSKQIVTGVGMVKLLIKNIYHLNKNNLWIWVSYLSWFSTFIDFIFKICSEK